MKMLFLTGGSPATVFAPAPLAAAARLAGHEVLVASPDEMVPFTSAVGLPTVPVTAGTMRGFMFADRDGRALDLPADPGERLRFNGRGFGRFAAASLPALRALAADWAPDLVVGGSLCYAAPLLAAEVGVPFVRHTWDLGEPPGIDEGAADELAPELSALGLDGLPGTDLWVDICPPSLRAADAPGPRQSMRFVPYNEQRALQPWMYRAPERPRVCVTAGSRVSHEDELAYLQDLLDSVADLDVELVVAAPEAVARGLKADPDRVRAGWIPLDVLLTTCRLIVHHGGGQTSLTALNAGVPQLLIPNIPKMLPPCERISARGAALTLPADRQSPAELRAAAEEILGAPSYLAQARAVRAEIARQPGPAEVVARLEDLAHG
ncbi:nucleotide disphospho-sugar-binding domain-containing protein [Streptomyces sp. ODS05-4]|uniref:nucleotide disphospho-sugar-binding domain-containing protein n=1 Tax=Streptomyces sp. ODS05-4 TaxID=2944939 RepID=UPI00210E0AB4|nr:nucleotide disphospho-sugar-binding domain-containing protein [Streptomyces sp. ODS05-4]